MRRKKIFVTIVLLVLLFFLGVIQVLILNIYSTAGRQLTKITKEIEDVEKENSRLSPKIASASSLVTISTKAQMLGFNKSTSFISITLLPPLAYSPETPL